MSPAEIIKCKCGMLRWMSNRNRKLYLSAVERLMEVKLLRQMSKGKPGCIVFDPLTYILDAYVFMPSFLLLVTYV